MLQRFLSFLVVLVISSTAFAQTNTKGVEFNNQSSSPCGVTLSCLYTTSNGGAFVSTASDGASAAAFGVNTSTGWSNATARLFYVLNNSLDKFVVLASGLTTITRLSIGTGQTPGLSVENTTAATSGNQQYSPAMEVCGRGWNGAASVPICWGIQVQPLDGTTQAGYLNFYRQYNGGTKTVVWTMHDDGSGSKTLRTPSGSVITDSGNIFFSPFSGYVLPGVDNTYRIGHPNFRWIDMRMVTMYSGAAVASQPTCDSTNRGGVYTVFATAGNSDTFQVCMKAAADTYAWRTVFTAP